MDRNSLSAARHAAAREAERYLSISRTTRSRLLASGVLHGSKFHVEDKHGRTEWHFAQAELDRLKQLHKPPSWRSLMRGHDA